MQYVQGASTTRSGEPSCWCKVRRNTSQSIEHTSAGKGEITCRSIINHVYGHVASWYRCMQDDVICGVECGEAINLSRNAAVRHGWAMTDRSLAQRRWSDQGSKRTLHKISNPKKGSAALQPLYKPVLIVSLCIMIPIAMVLIFAAPAAVVACFGTYASP